MADGAALLAAAIRAAVHAKAPRRTVQAVAAAVTGVLWRPTAAAEPHIDARVQAGTPVEELRANRNAQRQRKKDRRRSAAAKASNAAPVMSAEVLQCDTVRASAPMDVEVAIECGVAHGAMKSKRRRKGGESGRLGGGAVSGDVAALVGAEVLQCNAVRASAPMDVEDAEVLDDYWADDAVDDDFMKYQRRVDAACAGLRITASERQHLGDDTLKKYVTTWEVELCKRTSGAGITCKNE